MPPTLPPFTLLHIRLMGFTDLGPISARRLESGILEAEDGRWWGPLAVFSAEPVAAPWIPLPDGNDWTIPPSFTYPVAEAKPSRGALVWHCGEDDAWNLCSPGMVAFYSAAYTAYVNNGVHSYPDYGAKKRRSKTCPDLPTAIRQIAAWARDDGYTVPPHPDGLDQEPVVEPDTDGWIPWAGGACPVSGNALIDITYRDGHIAQCYRTDDLRWKHINSGGDIIAYRIVHPEPAPVEPTKPAKDRTRISEVRPGDRHLFTDGRERTVRTTMPDTVLYKDGTWIDVVDLPTVVGEVIPANTDDIPF